MAYKSTMTWKQIVRLMHFPCYALDLCLTGNTILGASRPQRLVPTPQSASLGSPAIPQHGHPR